MPLDQYDLCPCGSGKKVKWCCASLLPQAAQIVRLLHDKQYAHAERAITKALAEHPKHPLFVMLKLQAILEHECFGNEGIQDLLALARLYVRLRPNSTMAHDLLVDALGRVGTGELIAAAFQDYLEYMPAHHYAIELGVLEEYVVCMLQANPSSAMGWLLDTELGRVYGRIMAGSGSPRLWNAILARADTVPGITNCPRYMPPLEQLTDNPRYVRILRRALVSAEGGRFREAYQLADSLEDELPEVGFLTCLMREFLICPRIEASSLVDVLFESDFPQRRFAAAVVLGLCTGLWGDSDVVSFPVTASDNESREVLTQYMREHYEVLFGEIDKIALVARKDLLRTDGPLPIDAMAYCVGDGRFQFVLTFESPVPVTEIEERMTNESGLFRHDPVTLDRHDVLCRIVSMLVTLGGPEQREVANRLVQYAKEEWPLLPYIGKDMLELPKEAIQAVALVMERIHIAKGGDLEKASLWYDWLETTRPAFVLTKDSDCPRWLAAIDILRSDPVEVAKVLDRSGYPGDDIFRQIVQLYQEHFDNVSDLDRIRFASSLVDHVSDMTADPVLVDQVCELVRRTHRQGLLPAAIPELLAAYLYFRRFVADPSVETSRLAANQILLLIRDYAKNSLETFVTALTDPPDDWIEIGADVKEKDDDVGAIVAGMADSLAPLLFRALRDAGFLRMIRKDWRVRDLMPAARESERPTLEEDEEEDEDQYLVEYRNLVVWLDQAATGVVVVPENRPEPAQPQKLWTPDDVLTPSGQTESQRGQEKGKKKLWVPPS